MKKSHKIREVTADFKRMQKSDKAYIVGFMKGILYERERQFCPQQVPTKDKAS